MDPRVHFKKINRTIELVHTYSPAGESCKSPSAMSMCCWLPFLPIFPSPQGIFPSSASILIAFNSNHCYLNRTC